MREELTWHHRVNRVLNERLRPWWGTPRRVLLAVLVAFFFLVTTLCHYHEFQGKGTPPTLRVRNACNPCAGAAVPDYCALPQEYQFEKVIWFITDGYPLYMQREWLPLYADHAIPFVVEVPGRKWSHTVYTSWFTGMPNVNVLARPIYGDSLFESMRRASGHRCSLSPEKDLQTNNSTLPAFNLHWVGPTWCPVDLIGGAEYVKSNLNFVEIDPVVEELEMVPNPYPALPLDSLPAYLEEIAKKGQSLLTHTGLIDKAAHYGMEFDEPQEHLFELFANSGLREFIDAHPDYLLVLSSDHGLSMPGKFHGDGALKSSANIGMFTFYNPRFVGQNLTTMDVVDVLPTLTKYLKNVDIPFYSVGEVRNTYGPNNEQYEVNVLKQNLAQLRDLMAAEGKEVDDAAIDRAMSSNDTVALRDNVRAIKSVLFQAVTRPYYQYTIYTLVVLAVGCVVYWTRVVNSDAIHHTLLLALPLVFSFGFFLKPLDFYLFESNLTFYFGVGTSAFVACLLGGWSGTGYILLNELINLGGYFLRFTLDNTSLPVVSLVGIALSFIESRLYLSQQRTLATSSRNHLLALLLFLNVCNVMYVCTSFADAAYAGGINIFAFAIYASLPAVCVWLFVRALWSRACAASSSYTALAAPKMTPSVDALSISLTSFLLLLSGGSPLVFLFNLQSRQILPCLFGKPHVGGEKSEKAASTTSSAASHFAMQASAVYVLQGAMWVTWLVWGQTPDMEFDPKGGVAGIRSWNEYPTLAGALLVMQKAGVFPLAALHVGAMVVPNFFPLFILFLTTIINFLSVHMCFKRFSFKTPIESLLVITLLTWIQFLIMVLVKFNAQPEFADRNPWGFTIMKNFERKIVNPISAKVSERWRRKRV